jgi:hypothetical protein
MPPGDMSSDTDSDDVPMPPGDMSSDTDSGDVPMPPGDMSSDTDSGDDLARRGDTDVELGLRLDSRGDSRRPHLHRAIANH